MLSSSLNNPVLEEVDNISPEAKQALLGAHQHAISQMGVPPPETQFTPGSGPPAPTPAAPATPAPSLGAPMSPGLTHSTPTPVVQPSAQGLADRGELNRLTAVSTPGLHDQTQTGLSGIGQIHNPWARIPLQIADAVGQGFAPGIESALPGTQGQHQLLVQRAKARVGEDESLLNNEQKRGLEAAQTSAAASTPEFRQNEAANAAQKNQNAFDIAFAKEQEKHRALVVNNNTRLAKDGYILDETDPLHPVERPMKPEEMSDPAQANLALKRAQTESVEAHKELLEAQTKGVPDRIAQAQQRNSTAEANYNLALHNSQRRDDQWSVQKTGVDSAGNVPVGQPLTPQGTPVGSGNAKYVVPTNTTRAAAEQGGIVKTTGDQLIASIEKNRDKLGNVESYWKQYTNGSPIADPDVSGLMAQLASFAALQPKLHGFRSAGAVHAFEGMIGGIPKNPDALISAIKAAQGTANVVQQAGTPRTSNGGPAPSAGPVKVSTKAERDALAPGTVYIGPDGNQATKH